MKMTPVVSAAALSSGTTGTEAGSTTSSLRLTPAAAEAGGELVQAAEEWLRRRGVVKAHLLVRETNTEVVSFYEHLGFEVTPRIVTSKWLGQAT